MSGLVLNDDVKWISFASKYDFGYLLKTLTCAELPMDEQGFIDLLWTFFPCFYDVKVTPAQHHLYTMHLKSISSLVLSIYIQYMMTAAEGMHGGLSSLADALQITRIGPMHQAGSDSLLTAQAFFTLIQKHFNGNCDDTK